VLYVYGSYCALKDKVWEIKPININLKDYSKVFVGSPVWAGNSVPAINTFISNADFSGKEVIVFTTMGGNNPGKSISKMSSKISSRGGMIVGSFAIQTGRKTPEEISTKAKEAIHQFSQ
jgi:flavorubredoxin